MRATTPKYQKKQLVEGVLNERDQNIVADKQQHKLNLNFNRTKLLLLQNKHIV